jgi:hypothetical protein
VRSAQVLRFMVYQAVVALPGLQIFATAKTQ